LKSVESEKCLSLDSRHALWVRIGLQLQTNSALYMCCSYCFSPECLDLHVELHLAKQNRDFDFKFTWI